MAYASEVFPGSSAGPPMAGFEVAYVVSGGAEVRRPLADVRAVRSEDIAPVRAFTSCRGQRNFPGL